MTCEFDSRCVHTSKRFWKSLVSLERKVGMSILFNQTAPFLNSSDDVALTSDDGYTDPWLPNRISYPLSISINLLFIVISLTFAWKSLKICWKERRRSSFKVRFNIAFASIFVAWPAGDMFYVFGKTVELIKSDEESYKICQVMNLITTQVQTFTLLLFNLAVIYRFHVMAKSLNFAVKRWHLRVLIITGIIVHLNYAVLDALW